LGVPDPDQGYADSNQPVAAGYVLGWCRDRGLLPGITPEILDPATATWAGDAALLAAVLDRDPDILCLTCAMWNVERSLGLAREVRARHPGVRVIAGGPEIAGGCPWLDDESIDAFVIGEGETGLPLALAALDGSGERPRRIEAPPLAELAPLRDPYSAGLLSPGPAGNCLLEVTRGCPYGCHYCFYSKNAAGVRRHADESLAVFFRWAGAAGVRDAYLLDPTFNLPRRLTGRLSALARWNDAGIPLHTETRLEGIDAPQAAGFARAGFASVEAGLQSIHREVCAGVGRRLDRAAFARGAAALRDAGVVVEAGVILGLPGDSLPGFSQTLRWLERHGLAGEAAVFLLSLLPGTALRDRAMAGGWDFQERPPYFLRSGGDWDEARLLQGVYEVEEVLGRDHYVDLAPYGEGDATSPFLTRLSLDAADPSAPNVLEAAAGRMAWAVTLEVKVGDWPGDLAGVARIGAAYRWHCPFGLARLVVSGPGPMPPEAARTIRDAFRGREHYWTRLHLYRDDPVREYSVRLFQRVPASAWRDWLPDLPEELDLVFELPPGPAEFDRLAEALYGHPRSGRAYLAGGESLPDHYQRRIIEEVEENRTFLRWHYPPSTGPHHPG
jgi:radical SAM superfamily enzyme YgiQ (UPF0313 family)